MRLCHQSTKSNELFLAELSQLTIKIFLALYGVSLEMQIDISSKAVEEPSATAVLSEHVLNPTLVRCVRPIKARAFQEGNYVL